MTNRKAIVRAYDSPARRQQAEATRLAIANAARRLFTERGWAATTVREIARTADVSEPTVYNTYGGKDGLALALVESLESAAGVERLVARLRSTDDPTEQLHAFIAFDRQLFETGWDVILMLREAGRTVPELADGYAAGRERGRSAQRRIFASWPVKRLRLSVDETCDAYASLVNVDTYSTFVRERGWSPDRVEEWWAATVPTVLLLD